MQAKQRLDFNLSIKSLSEDGTFSGYASVFGVEDSYGDVVVKGAFAKSLENWKKKGAFPAMLWQHNMQEPIGVYTKMEEDDTGLYVEGKLLIDGDPLAKRAYVHMKAKSITGMSIGFIVVDWSYDSALEVYKLNEIDLWEVSLVTFPANDQARVQNVKSIIDSGELPEPKQVERVLRDAGLSRQQAKAFMAKGYSGIGQREADNSVELKSLTESMQSALSAIQQ
jgi:hypothetical protein